MQDELIKIDFSSFPHDEYSAQIEGKLFMSDNIFDGRLARVTRMSAPVQLSMTVIVLCLEGTMDIKINLQEYHLSESTQATMLSGSFMQMMDISKDFRGAIIAIDRSFMDYTEDVKMNMAMMRKTMNMPFYHISPEGLKETMQLYVLMKSKLVNPDFKYKAQVARMYLELFKYNGFQSFSTSMAYNEKPRHASRRDEIFEQFINEVQNNYSSERQVIYYADRLCISPKYLSSIVHDVSGKYATDWIDEYVILEAKALLKNRTIAIKEICQRMNFSTQSLFAKYFKQHTGMTPREYRNMP